MYWRTSVFLSVDGVSVCVSRWSAAAALTTHTLTFNVSVTKGSCVLFRIKTRVRCVGASGPHVRRTVVPGHYYWANVLHTS